MLANCGGASPKFTLNQPRGSGSEHSCAVWNPRRSVSAHMEATSRTASPSAATPRGRTISRMEIKCTVTAMRSFKPVESEFACLALSPFALSGKEADA
jgi:hypothetical protein